MKSYQFIKSVFLVFIMMSCLVACRSIDWIVRKEGITHGILLNEKGELTVIDGKSRRRVPKCDEWELVRKNNKYPPFKFECYKDIFDEKELSEIERFYKRQKSYDTSTKKTVDIIIIKDFEGSECRTFWSSATGEEIQICRPPF